MPVSFSVLFDRPHATYFAGETVSGKVVIRVDRAKKLRAIVVHFKGEANVRWSETRNSSSRRVNTSGTTTSRTVAYASRETYFETTHYFIGGTDGAVSINAGEYVYNFRYALPPTLPSSFEGTFGHIRYTVKALMQRPWKFDHGAKAAFTVVSPLDLNCFPRAQEPVELEHSKNVCCLWCRSGPIWLRVRLPSTGFVPGQAIMAQIQVDNTSNTDVRRILCVLEKEVKWRASPVVGTTFAWSWQHEMTRTTDNTIIELVFDEVVPAHDSKVMTQVIPVPALPPSNLAHCSIIDLQYAFKIVAVLGSCTTDVQVRCPILVGTIPVTAEPSPLGVPMTADVSAPPYHPDIPPPSYEECVFQGNNIMDGEDDNEYTMGDQNFTPRYPVYGFVAQQ